MEKLKVYRMTPNDNECYKVRGMVSSHFNISSHSHFVMTIFVWRTDRRLMGEMGCGGPKGESLTSSNMFISNSSPIITTL